MTCKYDPQISISSSTVLWECSAHSWGRFCFLCYIIILLTPLLLGFNPTTCFAETEVEGAVSGEWTAEDSPYIVVDSTWVPEDEELLISAGVEVRQDQSVW